MFFFFYCIDKPNSADLRQKVRADHIEYMIAVKGRTVFGGPLLAFDENTTVGSIFAIEFESRAHAEEFVASEPYNKNGLFGSLNIYGWKQMVPESGEGFLLRELERQRNLYVSFDI